MNKQIEDKTNSRHDNDSDRHFFEAGIWYAVQRIAERRTLSPESSPFPPNPPPHHNFIISGLMNDPAAFSKLVELAKEETLW